MEQYRHCEEYKDGRRHKMEKRETDMDVLINFKKEKKTPATTLNIC